jgi:hypothetical protein
MVYVWLAFILAGWMVPLWHWLQRRRASGWPVAEGRIESVEITKPRFSFTTKQGYYVAELGYSYSFAGTPHSGRYKREFPTEHEAEEFARDLQGKPVAVHCNSTSPSSSALLEPDVAGLLQNRPPAPIPDFPVAANSIPDWIRPFLWVFVLLSGVGLIVSLWVHVGAVMGRAPSSGSRNGTCPLIILLGFACWHIRGVVPGCIRRAAARRQCKPEGFMEGGFEGFT